MAKVENQDPMQNLTEQELAEYLEAFKCFDLNENGHLSTRELKCAMRILGSNPTDSEVQKLVNEKDYDGDGTLNFKEFVNVMESHRSLREENDVMALFSVFDPDNNGFTAGKCIKNSLSFLKDIPLAEINEILVKGQIADERKIFIEEFCNLLSPLIFREERHSTDEML